MKCNDCYYFIGRDDCSYFIGRDDSNTGSCRRYPPVFNIETSVKDRFPIVNKSTWCGEYRFGKSIAEVEGEKG